MRISDVNRLIALIAIVGSIGVAAYGQSAAAAGADTLSGRYEGTAKSEGAEAPVTLDIKREGDRITGRAVSRDTVAEIAEATFSEGTLTVKFVEGKGLLTAKVDGDKIIGDWVNGARKGTVELKKVTTVAAESGSENLSGEWDAIADANGQPFPFLLTLKVDGDKVSGGSSSQLGDSPISSGSWKDGQLSFTLDSANGAISMTATVIEGKLSGMFDYAGQLQGKWVAVRKK